MAKTPRFQYNKSDERKYAAQLRKIARHIGDIIKSHTNEDGIIPEEEYSSLTRVADLYAKAIEPWAQKVSWQMLTGVATKNKNDWMSLSDFIGKGIEKIVRSDPVSAILKDRQAEQVKLIKSIPIEAAERAKQLSVEVFTQGRRVGEAAQMIADSTGVSQARANVIARTETAKTNHDVSMARAKAIDVQKYSWETMQDEAVRPSHADLQGEIFDIDNPPDIEGEGPHGPGDWINCFPGSAKINSVSFIEKLYRRAYSGILISLVLDNGVVLSATPNHPILTENGFVAINAINKGENLVGMSDKGIEMIHPYVNRDYPTFYEIFNALNLSPAFLRSASIGGKFHGDITDQEVDIISPNRELISEIYSSVIKKMVKLGLSEADSMLCNFILIGDSGNLELLKSSYSSHASLMRGFNLACSLLIGHFTPFELLCFTLGSQFNYFEQMASDDPSADAVMFGDCVLAYSLLVHGLDFIHAKIDSVRTILSKFWELKPEFNKMPPKSWWSNTDLRSSLLNADAGVNKVFCVTDKIVTNFSGHVYNFETKTGYYHANNILSSNCRCFPAYILDKYI